MVLDCDSHFQIVHRASCHHIDNVVNSVEGAPGPCPTPLARRAVCRHVEWAVELFPCNSRECESCQAAWRFGNRCRIKQGAEALAPNQGALKFMTLTLARMPNDSMGGQIDRLSDAWRLLNRNVLLRRHKGCHWTRAFEAGTRNGRAHMHCVIDADIPVIPKLRPGEKLREWKARVEAAGFGPIMSVEVANTPQGVADYLAGYVAKNDRQLQRPDGRRTRLMGYSRNWPATELAPLCRVGQVAPAPEGAAERTCPQCDRELREAAELRGAAGTNEGYRAMRERNIRHWLRVAALDPTRIGTVEALFEALKRGAKIHTVLRPGRTARRRCRSLELLDASKACSTGCGPSTGTRVQCGCCGIGAGQVMTWIS